MKRREESLRRSQSAVMKEKREHEVERRSVRSRQNVQTSRETAEKNPSFFGHVFSAIFFSRCRVNSRLVTILTSFPFSNFFLNLADRGHHRVSDHSDIDVVMTARTSGADKGGPTV